MSFELVRVVDRQDYERQVDEAKSRFKKDIDDLKLKKKHHVDVTEQIKKLKDQHKKELDNLKSLFNQIKNKRPRQQEVWIPLGNRLESSKYHDNSNSQQPPEPRQLDSLRCIQNNISFQAQRKQYQQAAQLIKKKINIGNKNVMLGIAGNTKTNKPQFINSLKQACKRKAELELSDVENNVDDQNDKEN